MKYDQSIKESHTDHDTMVMTQGYDGAVSF